VIIHSIKTFNFRNLESSSLEFSPHANFISGLNGQGKTNLLEAIYWISALNGKKGTASDAYKYGERSFRISADITFEGIRHTVDLHVEGRSRKLTIDGSPPKRKRDYLRNVLVVDFFPEDLLILLMEPALRRRFLDIACTQFDLTHEEVLRRFKRTLEQRNSLLKNEEFIDPGVIDTFDRPLAELSAQITISRLILLENLGKRTDEIFREGIGEKYAAELSYLTSVDGIPSRADPETANQASTYNKIYYDLYSENRQRDFLAKRTTSGPHRDDFAMTLNGKTVRTFASRGEVRSAMFALHLARFHVLAEKRKIEPVVLIDDVMSELDHNRRQRVLELLPPGQVFLTSCDPPENLDSIVPGEIFHFEVDGGKVRSLD